MAISITQTQAKDQPRKEERKRDIPFLSSMAGRVRGKELMLFTSQISLMLETGHSLNRALEIMGPQIQNPNFREIVSEVLDRIESGKLFSEALEKYPKAFSNLFVSVIRVGETGGFLKQMMRQLADYYRQREEYLSAIRKALIYPLVLMVFAFLVVVFVMVYVFPKLAVFLEGKQALLPWSTRALMGLSHFLRGKWYIPLFGFMLCLIIIKALLKRPYLARWIERQRLKVPVLKNLFIQFYTSHFLSNLGFLMAGGVPLLEGLTVSKSLVKSSLYQEFIQEVIESVEKGAGFSAPFRKQPFLPTTVKEMVQTGEETGNLCQVIVRLGEHYAQEFRKGMEIFCTILEPIIIIFMGAVVGFVVLSIMIPIFRLSSGGY